MTDLARITGALEQSYAAVEKLCAGMSAAQWQAQSLCPDWTVRGVVGHLASASAGEVHSQSATSPGCGCTVWPGGRRAR